MNEELNNLINFTSKLNVLFIEDNDEVRNQLLKFLQNFFTSIDVATNGQDAYELYKTNKDKYQIILTDISMPRLDGIEFSKKIKAINTQQEIIVVSAHTEKSKLTQLEELGIEDILQKPLNYLDLVNVLTKLMKKKQS